MLNNFIIILLINYQLVGANFSPVYDNLETNDFIPANDLDNYIRYASHVFLPNESQPLAVN